MPPYDVVVVGARCAGATLAAWLAEAGLRVLLVDRATFPSPTLSTHTMHADSLAVLRDLGVLPHVEALGAPPVTHAVCDYGDFRITGRLPGYRGIDRGYCIPRVALDQVLVHHAAAAGVEVAERTWVNGVLRDGDSVCGVRLRAAGREHGVLADLVVGADGRRSTIASSVGSATTVSQRSAWALWFGYFDRIPYQRDAAYEMYFQGRSMFYVFPTTDGRHVVGGEFNTEEHPRLRVNDLPAFLAALRRCPGLVPRLEAARLVEGLYGLYRIESFMRRPAGRGWALVGDASFFKDPCTGQGMFDAFRGAQMLADLIVSRGLGAALDGYEARRDREFLEMFRYTCRAALSPPISAERRDVLRRIGEDPELTARYLGIHNHSARPGEVFSKARVRDLLALA